MEKEEDLYKKEFIVLANSTIIVPSPCPWRNYHVERQRTFPSHDSKTWGLPRTMMQCEILHTLPHFLPASVPLPFVAEDRVKEELRGGRQDMITKLVKQKT